MQQKIYLAGPAVFRPDALEHGERLKQLCADMGYVGLFPLDNNCPTHLTGTALARWIRQANLALIREADVVIADLNDFRGQEPDSGTAYEAGFASALGKPVIGYMDSPQDLRSQIGHDELGYDSQGMLVEDFGLPRNLMLAAAHYIVAGDFTDCLKALPAILPPQRSVTLAWSNSI